MRHAAVHVSQRRVSWRDRRIRPRLYTRPRSQLWAQARKHDRASKHGALRDQRLAFASDFTIERVTSRKTIAMTWPRRTVRFRSNAGRHVASPSLITHAPAGLARTPKPTPPFPSVSPPPPPPPMTLAAGM